MFERDLNEGDAAAIMLERRWFASMRAVRSLQAECETLREVVEMSEEEWRRARTELARLESLRDALGEELAERDALHEEFFHSPAMSAISSAA